MDENEVVGDDTPESTITDAQLEELAGQLTAKMTGEPNEEPAAGDEKTEDKPEPTYEVKVDGEVLKVSLGELLGGYSRQADYSRKTTALAAEKQSVEARARQLEAEKGQLEEGLRQLAAAMPEVEEPDWEALAAEPEAFTAELARYIKTAKSREAQRAVITAQAAKQLRGRIAQETELLVKFVPAFGEPERAEKIRVEAKTYLGSLGFKDQEIASIYDHRLVRVLMDAIEGKQLKARLSALKDKKSAKAGPELKPRGTGEQKTADKGSLKKIVTSGGPLEQMAEKLAAKLVEQSS